MLKYKNQKDWRFKMISLKEIPDGDFIKTIYVLENQNEYKIHINTTPILNKQGKYCELTFEDIINEIEAKEKAKISFCEFIAEFGLEGTVYRYENNQLMEWGRTRGYA